MHGDLCVTAVMTEYAGGDRIPTCLPCKRSGCQFFATFGCRIPTMAPGQRGSDRINGHKRRRIGPFCRRRRPPAEGKDDLCIWSFAVYTLRMNIGTAPRFAARLNAFRIGAADYWPGANKITTADLLARAATAGLTAADLNYPDHFVDDSPADLSRALEDNGMVLNGMAMRYYTDPGYKLGAFTHPDAAVRRAAIDETKRGLDVLAEMGGTLMTLWMGQDGFDYSFQMDYQRAWANTIDAMAEVADHNPAVDIALEYKPNEPRAFGLMPRRPCWR